MLHTVGGLTEAQVGAVLGSGAIAVGDHLEEADPLGLLGRVPDDVEVGPPPLDAIVAGSGRSSGARGRVLAGVATVVALLAAGTFVLLHDPAAPAAAPPRPSRATTATLPYLADGRLHVGALTLPVRGATDLTDPGVGAVYRTQEADVVLVDEEGGTAEIGHNAAPGLVADPARGWVFWRTYTHQLVVFDARDGHSVAIRTSLDPLDFFRFARPLALTEGTAYYGFIGGVVAWDLDADRVTHTGPDHPAFLARVGDLVVAPARHARRHRRDAGGQAVVATSSALVPARGPVRGRGPGTPSPGVRVTASSSTHAAAIEIPTGLPSRSRVTTVAFARDGAAAYVDRWRRDHLRTRGVPRYAAPVHDRRHRLRSADRAALRRRIPSLDWPHVPDGPPDGRVLRPRQDHHREVEHAGVLAAVPGRGADHPGRDAAQRLRAVRLPGRRRRPRPDGEDAAVHVGALRRLGRADGARDRRRHAAQHRRPARVRRGGEPDRGAPRCRA